VIRMASKILIEVAKIVVPMIVVAVIKAIKK